MACNQSLNGLAKDCSTSKGGVIEVYIANYEDVKTIGTESNKINSITMESTAKFKRYYLNKNTCNFVSTYNLDPTAGVRFVSTELNIVFTRMETAKRIEIAALAMNDLAVIVKDANNILWYLGKDEAVNASAGTGESGTQRTDKNGYNITLLDNSDELPFEVEPSVLADIVD